MFQFSGVKVRVDGLKTTPVSDNVSVTLYGGMGLSLTLTCWSVFQLEVVKLRLDRVKTGRKSISVHSSARGVTSTGPRMSPTWTLEEFRARTWKVYSVPLVKPVAT